MQKGLIHSGICDFAMYKGYILLSLECRRELGDGSDYYPAAN